MYGSIAIVGASLAGLNAAGSLRREGFEGDLIVVDADPATPYDKPPLSKQLLAGSWDVDRITLPGAKPDADLGIQWRLGERVAELEAADRRLRLASGEKIAYDGLVIATGAHARMLPGAGEFSGVHVLRTLADCLAVRDALDGGVTDVVVIGAGFIGAEVAATCRERGCTVTILEAAEVPFERSLGRVIGPVVADLHRDHGVDVRLGVGVDTIEADRSVHHKPVTGVRLADGSVVPAQLVVVGIGVAPSVDWLAGASPPLTVDNGVVTDATLLAAPGVVAAGDIARWPSARYGELLRIEHWENAIQMGEHAGRTLLAHAQDRPADAEAYDPVPWFWSDMFDRKIQLAGRSGPDHDVEVVIGSLEERRFVALYGRDGRVDGVLGWNRPRHVMQLRTLAEEHVPWADGLARARELA